MISFEDIFDEFNVMDVVTKVQGEIVNFLNTLKHFRCEHDKKMGLRPKFRRPLFLPFLSTIFTKITNLSGNRNQKPYFQKIRYHVDKLEQLVDDSIWPLPKFRELLFIK